MKSKLLEIFCQRHCLFITLVLTGLAFYPVYNFIMMTDIIGRGQFDITAIVPFMAVTVAIMAGFLLMPLLKRLPLCKKQILIPAVGMLIFICLDLLALHVASNAGVSAWGRGHNIWPIDELMISRAPPRLLDELMLSRAPRNLWPPYEDEIYLSHATRFIIIGANTIPWRVRIHYYVFSIVLVVAALNWLVNASTAISEKN